MSGGKTRDEMIESNMGLVHACARKFIGRGAEYEDLVQAGCVGLIKAVDNFDEGRGFLFSTYAVPVILGEIKRIFRDEGTVKVSRVIKERGRKIAFYKEEYSRLYGKEPTVSEISAQLGISEEETAQAINASMPVLSLAGCESDDFKGDFDIPVQSYDNDVSEKVALNEIIDTLEIKDRMLIEYRYFKGLNQTKTAQLLGMTQVQVSRKEKKILSLMRQKLA